MPIEHPMLTRPSRAEAVALAERCEKASGPDREIDGAIYHDLLGFCPHHNTVRSGAQSDTGFDCVDCGADSWGNKGSNGERLRDAAPAYTSSIDAAMTLLPTDGSMNMLDVIFTWEPGDAAVWPAASARWYPPHHSGPNWHALVVSAATLPLTICAAAFTARARALPQDGD